VSIIVSSDFLYRGLIQQKLPSSPIVENLLFSGNRLANKKGKYQDFTSMLEADLDKE